MITTNYSYFITLSVKMEGKYRVPREEKKKFSLSRWLAVGVVADGLLFPVFQLLAISRIELNGSVLVTRVR